MKEKSHSNVTLVTCDGKFAGKKNLNGHIAAVHEGRKGEKG